MYTGGPISCLLLPSSSLPSSKITKNDGKLNEYVFEVLSHVRHPGAIERARQAICYQAIPPPSPPGSFFPDGSVRS